jgi:hypothetical protein
MKEMGKLKISLCNNGLQVFKNDETTPIYSVNPVYVNVVIGEDLEFILDDPGVYKSEAESYQVLQMYLAQTNQSVYKHFLTEREQKMLTLALIQYCFQAGNKEIDNTSILAEKLGILDLFNSEFERVTKNTLKSVFDT